MLIAAPRSFSDDVSVCLKSTYRICILGMSLYDQVMGLALKTLNPTLSQVERGIALNEWEHFKEQQSPALLASLGIEMTKAVPNGEAGVMARTLGVHLVETTVKYRWDKMSPIEHDVVKREMLMLIAHCLQPIESEVKSVVDGVSRCLVEIIKQEWPQNWLSMMPEVLELASVGLIQKQVVVLTILRLIEDVAIMQTVQPPGRRKELHSAILVVLPDYFGLLSTILTNATNDPNDQPSTKLCNSAIEVLINLAEWLPSSSIDMRSLLEFLCTLATTEGPLKHQSADCLAQYSMRKGKLEDRMLVLHLMKGNLLKSLLNSAQTAAKDRANPSEYSYFKSLGSVFAGIGTQIAFCWGEKNGLSDAPENFSEYLSAVSAFLSFPSIFLRSQFLHVLLAFAKNGHIADNAEFRTVTTKSAIEAAPVMLLKVGYPSKKDSLICEFSRLDYDDDTEFSIDFSKARVIYLDFIRTMIPKDPEHSLQVAVRWLQKAIGSAVTVNVPEWESLAKFLNCVIAKIISLPLFNREDVQATGEQMIRAILATFNRVQDFATMGHLLSCLADFTPFLRSNALDPNCCPVRAVLGLVFKLAALPVQPESFPPSAINSLKELKSHCPVVLIKMAMENPEILLPYTSAIVSEFCSDQLTLRQRSSFIEAGAIVSNKFPNFTLRVDYVKLSLDKVNVFWNSEEFLTGIQSPENFVNFIGFASAPLPAAGDSKECRFVERRKQLIAHVTTIIGLVKRILPEKLDGSFDGESFHTAFSQVQPLLQNLFLLARCLNGVYTKSAMSMIHPGYGVQIIDVPKADKCAITGLMPVADGAQMFPRTTMADFVQGYFWELSDHVMLCIGCCFVSFQREFFQLKPAKLFIESGLLAFIECSVDFRLRNLLKFCIRPLVESATAPFYPVVVPALCHLIGVMHRRLCSNWDVILKRIEPEKPVDPEAEDQSVREIFFEEMTRLLTRQYLDVVILALFQQPAKSSRNGTESVVNDGDENEDAQMDDLNSKNSGGAVQCVSDLGAAIFSEKDSFGPAVMSVFQIFRWVDTASLIRCCAVCGPLVRYLMAKDLLDPESAKHILHTVLCALQSYGEKDDSNVVTTVVAIAMTIYELLRPAFPEVRSVMLQIQDCTEDILNKFDEQIVGAEGHVKRVTEKVKKDQFRRMVKSIIAENVGQKFKRKLAQCDLPPLLIPSRKVKEKLPDGPFGIESLFGTTY